MIELKNIRKEYETVTPIQSLDLTINRGDVISIIGPSGTGKSTLLRMINMLERPTSGSIFVDGDEITVPGYPLHKVRQKIGMVFQSFNLFNHMTVIENIIDAPVFIKKQDPSIARSRGMELLDMVGLAEFADAYPASLSGGQKQRVAIARTLAMEPDMILFDEPTSALDPTMVGEVEAVIRDLAKQGYTMMLVTHDMSFAETVANRVLYLDEGGVYEDGTPEQVFHSPVREKTKAFVMRLKEISCVIDRPTFDYISFRSKVEEFIYKNEMSGGTAKKLRAIVEELISGIILTAQKEQLAAGKKITVFEFRISYSHKNHSIRVIMSWDPSENDAGTDSDGKQNIEGNETYEEFIIPQQLIRYYADDIEHTDEHTIRIKIKES